MRNPDVPSFRLVFLGDIGTAAIMKAAMSQEQWAALNEFLDVLDSVEGFLYSVKCGDYPTSFTSIVTDPAAMDALRKLHKHPPDSAKFMEGAGVILGMIAGSGSKI